MADIIERRIKRNKMVGGVKEGREKGGGRWCRRDSVCGLTKWGRQGQKKNCYWGYGPSDITGRIAGISQTQRHRRCVGRRGIVGRVGEAGTHSIEEETGGPEKFPRNVGAGRREKKKETRRNGFHT